MKQNPMPSHAGQRASTHLLARHDGGALGVDAQLKQLLYLPLQLLFPHSLVRE
jgi:hypothetical protein